MTFTTWGAAHSANGGSNPQGLVGQDMVIHLISDDIYIDIKFTSWSGGAGGGGFAYERSTNNMSTINIENSANITLHPNPSSDFIYIEGLDNKVSFTIYNNKGKQVLNGLVDANKQINIQKLTQGMYFLSLENENKNSVY